MDLVTTVMMLLRLGFVLWFYTVTPFSAANERDDLGDYSIPSHMRQFLTMVVPVFLTVLAAKWAVDLRNILGRLGGAPVYTHKVGPRKQKAE